MIFFRCFLCDLYNFVPLSYRSSITFELSFEGDCNSVSFWICIYLTGWWCYFFIDFYLSRAMIYIDTGHGMVYWQLFKGLCG